MGKYLNKSKIAGDVSHPITRAAKNLALQRLRSDSTSPSDDADSFRYLQLRSRRLVKLPLLPDTKKQLIHARNPRAKKSVSALAIETEEDCGSNEGKYGSDCNFGDLESGNRSRRDLEATQSVPSTREIEDFFAYAEQQQQRLFMEKYNYDIVSENPLPGRYEWVKVEP